MCLLSILIIFLVYFAVVLVLSTFLYPLPINDARRVRYKTLPWMTITLIVINTVVFLVWIAPDLYGSTSETPEMELSDSYTHKMDTYGFSEHSVRSADGVGAFATFTSIFMHVDIWHLFGNMLYLWAFGRRVEDACGPWRYLLFYLGAGMLANLGSVLLNPVLDIRSAVGASGAISGVMGAYLLLFPGTYLTCLWGVGVLLRVPVAAIRRRENRKIPLWRWTVDLPAWVLLIWFVVQDTLPSLETMASGEEISGVNHLAHLSGYLAALTIFLYVRKDLLMRYIHGRSL